MYDIEKNKHLTIGQIPMKVDGLLENGIVDPLPENPLR